VGWSRLIGWQGKEKKSHVTPPLGGKQAKNPAVLISFQLSPIRKVRAEIERSVLGDGASSLGHVRGERDGKGEKR